MRLTLHLAAAAEYPAYAQLARQPRMRKWRSKYAHLDEARVARRARRVAGASRARTTRSASTSRRYEGVTEDAWTPVIFARTLLALVQLPPAGALG